MRWNNLYVAGVGAYLPEHVETADEAIAAGRYTEQKRSLNGFRSVHVAAEHETGPTMAALAGRQAVARSRHADDEFGLVLHSYIGHQGLDFWTPASFVQRETVGGSAPAFEIKQGCNGMLAAFEVASSYVAARPDVTAALVTGGDAFRMPYIDRWGSDEQNVDGDGAAAVVLSGRGGFARVRSTYSHGDPSLEPMGRSGAGWTDTPFAGGETIGVSKRKSDYLLAEDMEFDDAIEKISASVEKSMARALADADAELSDVRWFLHQNLALSIVTHGLYGLLGVERERTTHEWGLGVGMVGTADPVLGLNRVMASGEAKPGDLVVLQAAGAGYVWTTVVLEILEVPAWES
ncbi:ketoacyl-ACP synthase III family protein [Streptomyces laurentii]|uniref:ketoacyl-ACP synthase III family protein n=1 Tax=Streptomyces laurentii TaxID=39478 RepID=UPI0036A46742